MFSFLTGSKRGREHETARLLSPFTGSPETSRNRAVGQYIEDDQVDSNGEQSDDIPPNVRPTSYFDRANADDYEDEEEASNQDGNEDAVATPLLPIFSAAHLDRLPLYNITHAIRLLIIQKCETTLSWEQLRSPQISQFLVKPIQNQIQSNHFNRATLCALIANCLQFQKEGQLHPGNVGVSKTRALISELLAMRLIKEFSTRELIDALSYDFDPLQGISPPTTATPATRRNDGWAAFTGRQDAHERPGGARVSTIEISIRAQAKRFLAHPVVVQHLEAIWAGSVVFHSEADNLHRKPSSGEEPFMRSQTYGTINEYAQSALPADSVLSRKARGSRTNKRPSADLLSVRRSVTLYDPRDASLFKLSRLRVPRYRQIFSTISFATMLALFLAVLVERNLYITPLEVLFWFWSAGYMLDEIVGFSEQGFGLYILSFWNAFDLGILLLFIVFYCLRLYGLLVAEEGRTRIANAAYDVLASTAILLFPRLFSVLDHYRYFSQLLIAFRMMAQDLMAILFLILISCSGFFVAFFLSGADEDMTGNGVAYTLFQILMGFTPAAWEKWSGYSVLGKIMMTAFLIICHFVIVTILITVLTNSFMAIVQNANEEHQFLFAVNTISMVKSDALFSYIAPTNVVGWTLSPMRYIIPFRRFVKFNRTVIKVTHFPLLFAICGYERMILSKSTYEATDLVDKRSQAKRRPLAFGINKEQDAFSPGRRLLREPSVLSFSKDRALDEVFRRPFKGSTIRTTPITKEVGRRTSTVDKWMQVAEIEGGASPPIEQPRSVLERLETRRPPFARAATADRLRMGRRSREFSATRSLASEPDIMSTVASRRPHRIDEAPEDLLTGNDLLPQETDADGDDEANLDSELAGPAIEESASAVIDKENRAPKAASDDEDFFHTPTTGKSPLMQFSTAPYPRLLDVPDSLQVRPGAHLEPRLRTRPLHHNRKASTGTAFYVPEVARFEDSSSEHKTRPARLLASKTTNTGGTVTPNPIHLKSGQRTPKMKPVRTRPIMPPVLDTAPGPVNAAGLSFVDFARPSARQTSFTARALDLASDIGDNKFGPVGGVDVGGISGMPNSFSEQLLREKDIQRRQEAERRKNEEEEKGMVNRIMLARMNTLEEGFRDLLKEIKDLSRSHGPSRRDSEVEGSQGSTTRGMQTPSRRDSLNGNKSRKQQLKKQATKGKAPEKQVRLDAPETPSPGSIDSILERQEARAAEVDEKENERPGTAVRTPKDRSA